MTDTYNKFSQEYDKLFAENIVSFIKNIKAKKDLKGNYRLFYPSFGVKENEKCDFIIYGQAVKDWSPDISLLEDKRSIADKVKESIIYSNSYLENHCPLDWVNVYWSKKSYTLNTLKKEAEEFYPPIDYTTSRSFFWECSI
ncbi:MAG: hypothetical protein SGJ10_05040 [Bacteroidota bacterium]|nr:hypothetical protein [Bacteroidota bacterium]